MNNSIANGVREILFNKRNEMFVRSLNSNELFWLFARERLNEGQGEITIERLQIDSTNNCG